MAKKQATRKVRKSAGPSGRMSGPVPFQPSVVSIEKRLGEGRPFSMKKWMGRFHDPRTGLVERIGMLRSIPCIRFGRGESLVAVRGILMPLADGLEEYTRTEEGRSQRWNCSEASFMLLRKEAWFMLHEWFFKNAPAYSYAESSTFLEDISAYYRQREGEEWRRGEWNFGIPNFLLEFCPSGDQEQNHARRTWNDAMKKRAGLALEHAKAFLAEYFKRAWNLREQNAFIERDSGTPRLEEAHAEISVGRRRDLFGLIIRLDPAWLRRLPWDKSSFQDMVNHFTIQHDMLCLKDRLPGKTISGLSITEVPGILISIALENQWIDLPGVLTPRLDP